MGEKTSIKVVDQELWAWAQYRAKILGMTTSEYLFALVRMDREGKVKWPRS